MKTFNPFTLEGKTILVTGASSGIGKAIAIACSKMRATLVINGRNAQRLQETFLALEGNNHKQFIGDITQTEIICSMLEEIPNIQGIVHSAGITKILPFAFADRDKMEEIMAINFFAPAELTRLMLKTKKLDKGSSIVFISSVSGVWCSAPGGSMYAASKGAINGLIKGMALDLAPKGIRINSVNPAVIETAIFNEGTITHEQLEENKKQYPLGRFGKPEEVAYAVIYLLSDASAWVTGSNLLIDGGLTLQ
jgi:NAD(P)-dependent dehydrogenase (short-subunit alcohol dehydrogenase family)